MKLKDCCIIIAGQSPESKYYNREGVGLPFFQGKADFGSLYPTIRVYCSKPTKVAEKGDILLSVRAPVGPTNLAPCTVCIGRGLTAIRPSDKLLTRYVLLYFRYFEAQLASKGTGTTFKAITQDVVKNLDIPVPSLDEQARIVARIEEMFSELDAGVETLKKTKAQLAVYRQAVLKEAFDSIEASFYHPLRAAILGSPQNGLYKPKSDYCDNGTPILRIDGFYDGFILSDYSFKRVNLSAEEIERYRLELGDLVVNRVNSMPYLGKCALVRSLIEPTVFESNMMRIKLDTDKVEGDWITYYLSSHSGRKELTKNAKQAVNQASINQTDVGNALVPIPSINEQKRLVTVIESRLSVCDSIDQTIDMALQQSEAMRQSILKDAFEGRL
ncbi:MAG: restriction endonuclease subunit S [Clostridia bacterium]|nr:restriction endonuclease subunit S [Clostridia bacterium]